MRHPTTSPPVPRPAGARRGARWDSRAAVVVGAWALAARVAAAQGAPDAADAPDPRGLAPLADSAAAAHGLPSLRGGRFPASYREVRVWVMMGMFTPNQLLRVVEAGRAVSGEAVSWWRAPAPP